jgi:hypothetical protein
MPPIYILPNPAVITRPSKTADMELISEQGVVAARKGDLNLFRLAPSKMGLMFGYGLNM